MLFFLWFQGPLLSLAERIGGTGLLALCLGVLLVWNAALMYFKFGAMERAVVDVRHQMVTRKDLTYILQEMETRLKNYADERFLTRHEYSIFTGKPPQPPNYL